MPHVTALRAAAVMDPRHGRSGAGGWCPGGVTSSAFPAGGRGRIILTRGDPPRPPG